MKYYRLNNDFKFPGRWVLGDINIRDNWLFSSPVSVNLRSYRKLKVELYRPGIAMDYSSTALYGVSIISTAMTECLSDFMDDIQLIPIMVPGTPAGAYNVLIINNAIDCVDEKRSTFDKFQPGNKIRPDKVGEYNLIYKLKIDTGKVDRHIFLLDKYDVFMIVSEKVKKALTKKKLTGLDFELVS